MDKYYGIHDDWPDLEKSNDVEIKSKDGVIESVLVNGEESGSGTGGGDFKKANVTVICSGGVDYFAGVWFTFSGRDSTTGLCLLDDEGYISFSSDPYNMGVSYGRPVTVECYVFQDKSISVYAPEASSAVAYTVTGDCEVVTEEQGGETLPIVKVYGDCTISLVGKYMPN